MLESLALENFQCHRNIQLDFCPGVNVIAGSSDIGKSAILKGLIWLLTNRPQGLGFRNLRAKKGDSAYARIVLDGRVLERRRSESINEYLLDGKRFVAMGNDVPEPIVELLDIGAVNIQTQFQSHFLLSASSREVAKALNDACNLSIIDESIKRVKGIMAVAKTLLKEANFQLGKLEKQLADLDWVEDADRLAQSLESEMQRVTDRQSKATRLEGIAHGLFEAQEQQADLQRQIGQFSGLSAAVTEQRDLEAIQDKRDSLYALVQELKTVQASIDDSKASAFAGLADILDRVEELRPIAKQADLLGDLIAFLGQIKEQLGEAKMQNEKFKTELAQAWGEADMCPLCGARLEDSGK